MKFKKPKTNSKILIQTDVVFCIWIKIFFLHNVLLSSALMNISTNPKNIEKRKIVFEEPAGGWSVFLTLPETLVSQQLHTPLPAAKGLQKYQIPEWFFHTNWTHHHFVFSQCCHGPLSFH